MIYDKGGIVLHGLKMVFSTDDTRTIRYQYKKKENFTPSSCCAPKLIQSQPKSEK